MQLSNRRIAYARYASYLWALCLVVGLSGCRKAPHPYPYANPYNKSFFKFTTFTHEGGSFFYRLYRADGVQNQGPEDFTYIECCSYEYYEDSSEIKVVEMKVENGIDGSLRISNDWIAFSLPPDRRFMVIKVQRNNTGKERNIHIKWANALGNRGHFEVQQQK